MNPIGQEGLEERLFESSEVITETGCRLWKFAVNPDGYGKFVHKGTYWQAHRAMWTCLKGRLAHDKLVLHTCDVPSCINIDHLFVGTQADNMKDMVAKGRANKATGERSNHVKLKDLQVIEIKRRLQAGESPYKIAPDYGVHGQTIKDIQRGRTWNGVGDGQTL